MKPFFNLVSVLILLGWASHVTANDESLALLVKTLQTSDNPSVQAALLKGMLSGLAGRRNVPAPDGWQSLREKLAKSESNEVRDLTTQLSQIFGDADTTRQYLEILKNTSAERTDRRAALRALLLQQNQQAAAHLETLLGEPAMQLDAIRGYAAIETKNAAKLLLARYAAWSPNLQRAVVETLASRQSYAEALLVALRGNKISRDDIPAHVARSLQDILGDRFTSVYGEIRKLADDRAAQLARFKKMASADAIAKADASRGRAVFNKTCAACHLMYGHGGKIGPDLTGSNRANLDYLLLNSIDPSYDVPQSYKMVTILTNDGRFIKGVVAEEDDSRIVLKTVEQPLVVIAKEDIDERKVSSKSMMPDGQLEKMKTREVLDLIKYMQTTEQIEAPK